MTASSRVAGFDLPSLRELNGLPPAVRDAVYARLVPAALIERCGIDPGTGLGRDGHRVLRIVAPAEESWVRVEVRASPHDRDPLLLIDLEMSPLAVPELSFVQITDPVAARFDIDRDTDGADTLFGTRGRNLDEEVRALAAGLAPGQVRRGLRLLGPVLDAASEFCRLLGQELFLVEPLFYHSAWLYERHGCGYLLGRELMDEIHEGFQPGGPLHAALDDGTVFRRRGAEATVRGRSWAIHDGVLGERRWGGVKMYRLAGRAAGLATFPGGRY